MMYFMNFEFNFHKIDHKQRSAFCCLFVYYELLLMDER